MRRSDVAMNMVSAGGPSDLDAPDLRGEVERRVSKGPGHTLVLSGELDPGSTHTLMSEIARLCRDGATGITLDLTGLDFIDPTGVAAVLFMCRWCQKSGYDVALIPGSWLIQRSFELAGLIDRLPFIAATPPAADPGPGGGTGQERRRPG